MNILVNNLFKRIYNKVTGVSYQLSYSQTGEDIIIEFLIGAKKIKNFTYLDIGANHPVRLNNTFKFYELGSRGVCIEPSPDVYAVLKKKRPKDICLNIGIGPEANAEVDFYVMEQNLLNTFSKEEAMMLEKENHSSIKKVIKIQQKTVSQIIEEYFNSIAPVFINLDVEGLDEVILNSFPFDKYRPFIFCIETVNYTSDASSAKRSEIFKLMEANNYKPFADTYLNTIFIDDTYEAK